MLTNYTNFPNSFRCSQNQFLLVKLLGNLLVQSKKSSWQLICSNYNKGFLKAARFDNFSLIS
jgi:hypothetical protein